MWVGGTVHRVLSRKGSWVFWVFDASSVMVHGVGMPPLGRSVWCCLCAGASVRTFGLPHSAAVVLRHSLLLPLVGVFSKVFGLDL